MGASLWSITQNLIASIIGATAVWSWQRLKSRKRRREWLAKLQEAASNGELAICVGIATFDPVPDVVKYLREHHPNIRQLIAYRISPEEAKGNLTDPDVALRIIEDICDGMRDYGKGELARIHFFPAGVVAYPFIMGKILGNWGPVVVYHRLELAYIPLYSIGNKWMFKSKRDSISLKKWESIAVEPVKEKSISGS